MDVVETDACRRLSLTVVSSAPRPSACVACVWRRHPTKSAARRASAVAKTTASFPAAAKYRTPNTGALGATRTGYERAPAWIVNAERCRSQFLVGGARVATAIAKKTTKLGKRVSGYLAPRILRRIRATEPLFDHPSSRALYQPVSTPARRRHRPCSRRTARADGAVTVVDPLLADFQASLLEGPQ
jgi:hypothetical protein